MNTLNIKLISRRLFEDQKTAARLCRDFGLELKPDAEEMAAALIESFDQGPPKEGGIERETSNAEVFHAAVLALASNSRAWSSFLKRESQMRSLLLDYDPRATKAALESERLDVSSIKECLPGQTSSGDARAITRWAHLLAEDVPYYAAILHLREHLRTEGLRPEEEVPMVAAFLGATSNAMERRRPPPSGLSTWKLPGMGPVLGSEFLRNLRWSAFKPDRHIKRLLGMWFPEEVEGANSRAEELAGMLGSRAKDVVEFLTYSLVGSAVTPEGRTFTEADGLLWALGAYVEKRGRESAIDYRLH